MRNQKLQRALNEKRWSLEVASEKMGISRVTLSRWVNGHQEPQPVLLAMLCQALEKSPGDLGYDHLDREPLHFEKRLAEARGKRGQKISTFAHEQTPALEELLKLGESMMFDQQKRQTLQTLLLALSSTVIRPEGLLQPETWQPLLAPATDEVKVNEATIEGFAKLIEACKQFCQGTDLALAEKLLPECMTQLVTIAQQSSRYQKAAANLAAQGFRLCSILALHRNNPLAEELYGKQAVEYSLLAEDQNLFIATSIRLGNKYYYQNQYEQALQTFLRALQQAKEASSLTQTEVYTNLAKVYAHVNQKQDALMYLGMAQEKFPAHPETDASFSYGSFGLSQMILWEGVTRSQLEQTNLALEIFNRVEQPNIIISERHHIEIINQQAKTAIFAGDLARGSAYVEAGVAGAKALGSQRRYSEAYENFRQMTLLWPQERQVKELRELFA